MQIIDDKAVQGKKSGNLSIFQLKKLLMFFRSRLVAILCQPNRVQLQCHFAISCLLAEWLIEYAYQEKFAFQMLMNPSVGTKLVFRVAHTFHNNSVNSFSHVSLRCVSEIDGTATPCDPPLKLGHSSKSA